MRNGKAVIPGHRPLAPDRPRRRRVEPGRTAVDLRCQGGFTYIGLLIAVAIIGTVLATAGVVWHTAQQREREQELLFVGDQFRQAIAHYYRSGRQYPDNLEDLLQDPRLPGVTRYLRKLYRDPITGTTDWGLVRDASHRIVGVFSQSEAQPIKHANFSAADQGFEGQEKYSQWVFAYQPRLGRVRSINQPPPPAGAGNGAPKTPP